MSVTNVCQTLVFLQGVTPFGVTSNVYLYSGLFRTIVMNVFDADIYSHTLMFYTSLKMRASKKIYVNSLTAQLEVV